jgi:hypothetical protein
MMFVVLYKAVHGQNVTEHVIALAIYLLEMAVESAEPFDQQSQVCLQLVLCACCVWQARQMKARIEEQEEAAITVHGWPREFSIVSSHYLAMMKGDRIFCPLVAVIYGVCKLVRLLQSFVVRGYKCPVNKIVNPDTLSSQ